MLNIMKIPWVEKCPWLASVATRYSLNVLTRQPEQKETSFMKILPAKRGGGWFGRSAAGSNFSRGCCDFVEGGRWSHSFTCVNPS